MTRLKPPKFGCAKRAPALTRSKRQEIAVLRRKKHGTALAIEPIAKNFNALSCRFTGNVNNVKGSTS
jgi:hypothetical protein